MENTPIIPKKIHYCWFGNEPVPPIAKICIDSWKKFCPDFEIFLWDESNCDLSINEFVKCAAQQKKWAFVSDYFRLKKIEEHGGIYLDIDVEIIRNIEPLLTLKGYMGFEQDENWRVNTGLGFGAIPNHPAVRYLRKKYDSIKIDNRDRIFNTACPERDTEALVELGLKQNNRLQQISQLTILPAEFLSPFGFYGQGRVTENTYSVHHFNASWFDSEQKKLYSLCQKSIDLLGYKIGSKINLLFIAYYDLKRNGVISVVKKALRKLKGK